jgi:hypothetical protein
MRYFLLSVFLLALIRVSGQSLQFFDSQNLPLNNGDTLIVTGSIQTSEMIAIVKVKNLTNNNLEVTCKKWQLSIVPGSTNVFCWANLCYPPNVNVSNSMIIPAGVTVDDFSGHYYPNGNSGVSIVMYSFDVRGADSAWFYVKYDVGQGISDNQLNKLYKPFPNPASKEVLVSYSINNSKYSFIEIYDVLGNKQMVINLNGKQNFVQIPVYNLKNGLYFIQLRVDGRIIGTEKIIVNK